MGKIKKKTDRKEQRKTRQEDRENENINKAIFEDEGVLVQKMLTVPNNAVVVSIDHEIEPPGVSHWAVSPILQLSPGEDTGARGTDTEFLSKPHPAGHTGLPMSLYTLG